MKRFIKTAFQVLSALLAISYLFACFSPYISPSAFWPMGFFGLAFPVLLLLVLLLAVVWFFVKRKIALGLMLVLCVGYKNISVLFAINRPQSFVLAKQPNTIRILSWNTKGFDTHDLARDSTNSLRHKMLAYVAAQNADVLCLQDFTEYHNPLLPSNIAYLKDSLHYPYHYFADDYKAYPPWGPSYSGIAIFSRYPFSRVEQVPYTGKITPESIIVADIIIRNTRRRIIVTHLQSMHLRRLTPAYKMAWDSNEDSAINYTGNLPAKLKFYMPYHALQSQLVKKQIAESPYPVIFSADLNEVPTSYAYNQVKGQLKDVFLMKGFGLGRTYYTISPTLRIDYLLVSPSVNVVQYKKDDIFMSDHYPQVMDVNW